jgi:hypothetical protein
LLSDFNALTTVRDPQQNDYAANKLSTALSV